MEIHDQWPLTDNPIAWAKEPTALPEGRERMAQFCCYQFKIRKEDVPAGLHCSSNPLVKNCQQSSTFWFLEPNGFGNPVKIKTEETLSGVVCSVALLKLLEQDGVSLVIPAWWEDIMYTMQDAPCHMFDLIP